MIKTIDDVYQGINYRLVFHDKSEDKPIIFFFHGFLANRLSTTWDKEYELAKMGYTVLLIDAFLHGGRMTEEFKDLPQEIKRQMMIDIQIQTADDVLIIYQYLVQEKILGKDQRLGLMGVSMGAGTAFYLASIFPKAELLVSIVGSPSFVEMYQERKATYNFPKDEKEELRLQRYSELDPLINSERLKAKKIMMVVGKNDQIVPLKYAKELAAKIPCLYREYETGHDSTPLMMEDVYQFIQDNLL